MNARFGGQRVAAAALCLLAAAIGGAADAHAARVDPTGTWYCLVYGPGPYDDVYVSLRFDDDGRGEMTWGLANRNRYWRPLSNTTIKRRSLTFNDPTTGRTFEGDLSYATLGGTWRGAGRAGGWWCSSQTGALAADSEPLRHSRPALPVPLASTKLEAPRYPVQAIREAKEGRAVACFFVDRKGFIVEPELVELSDEVFRAPTLRALGASRFEEAERAPPLRPGCRSYVYNLDPIR